MSLCPVLRFVSPLAAPANGTSSYTHFGFPPSDLLPSLSSTLNFTFTPRPSPPCTFLLCARPLIAAPHDYTQWPLNCAPYNLYNLTGPWQRQWGAVCGWWGGVAECVR